MRISDWSSDVCSSDLNALATPKDIAKNPKNFQFKELESAMLPRVLDQVDLDMINTNYALEAGLNPDKDALVIEGSDSPYVNFLVARPEIGRAHVCTPGNNAQLQCRLMLKNKKYREPQENTE